MRNLTKASREASRTAQFDYLVNKGYSRETYKALDFFTIHEGKYYTLKIYRGTAASPEHYVNYRTEEARAQAIQNYKANYESREAYKAEQKIKNKGRLSSHAATAAAIREELKKNFAGVKFSVTSESYAGGNSCRISWTDGPTTREVEAITGKYQYGSFDGMTDSYNYTNSRDDIPQTKYVQESRTISDDILNIVVAELMELRTYSEDELNDFSRTGPKQQAREILAVTAIPLDYTGAKVITDHSDSLNYFKLVFTTPEQPKAKQPQGAEATEAGEVNIIDYSEKAFAVIGDFSGHYDNLINLGGKYNKFLKCGRGIIFSKTKLKAVKSYFESIQAAKTDPEATPPEAPTTETDQTEPENIELTPAPLRFPELEAAHPLNILDKESPQYNEALKDYILETATKDGAKLIPTPETIYNLESLTILWHEGKMYPNYENKIFSSWDDVQTAFLILWAVNERGKDAGYSKVKVKLKLLMAAPQEFRIDITDKEFNGYFNPSKMHIVTYVQSIMKEQDEHPTPKEDVKKFDNLEDIRKAAESGEVISLLNLSELINQKKSPECSHVLQTMDRQETPNYHEAIKETLQEYPNANLNNLETELNKYI
jgi:hypothetical protein